MILTMEQDKLLRKYTTQVNDESLKIKSKNLPQNIKDALIDIDESNMILYGKHLITNIQQIKDR